MNDTLTDDRDLYSTPQASRVTGATMRQIDHWARTGILIPLIQARGSGTRRRWARAQLRVMRLVVVLSALGADHQHAIAPAALRFQEHPWLWDEEAVVVTPDGRVQVVRTLTDLTTGWTVNPAAEAADVDAWLDRDREPATLAG